MAEYRCRVGTADGLIGERLVAAESADVARQRLSADGLTVFEVRRHGGIWQWLRDSFSRESAARESASRGFGSRESGGKEREVAPAAEGNLRQRRFFLHRRRRLAAGDLLLLNQELAALVRAGLPLLRCLDILRGRRARTVAGEILDRVRQRVAGGFSLSRAFEAEEASSRIPTLYITTLAVGEAGGDLEGSLRRYAQHLERSQDLRRRVRGALLYPTALFAVSMAVISVLVGFVLPRFAAFYASYEAELPVLTRLLVTSTEALRANAPVLLIALVAMALGLVGAAGSEAGRRFVDLWSLELPIVGRLRRLYLDLEATRTLATLVSGGAPLVQALEVAARGSDNSAHRERLRRVGELVRQGSSLHGAFETTGLLEPMGLEMVEVGESTGSLETMLEHVASTYDEILERRLNTAVGLLEPAVLVGMGFLLAAVLLSLYLPLFRTVQVVG